MTLRTTVYLDEQVIERIRRFIPQRGLSQVVNDLLKQRATELEKAELEAQMIEGYLATQQERATLNADWQVLDGEGWKE